jgi:membrane protein
MTKFERLLVNFAPIKWLILKSKSWILPGCSGFSLYHVITFFVKEIQRDGIYERAAAISFNFLLAIPPTFIFICTLAPYLPIPNIDKTLYQIIKDVTPNSQSYLSIKTIVHDFFFKQRNGLLSIGFLLALFYSSNGMMALLRTFNRKTHLGLKKRNMLQSRFTAIKLTLLVGIVFIVSLAFIVLQSATLNWLLDLFDAKNKTIKNVLTYSRWLVLVSMIFLTISTIFYHGPALQKKWKFVNPGGIIATILSVTATLILSYVVNNFSNYNKLYGSLGTILIVMLWVFYNAQVLLVGFELNASIELNKIAKAQTPNLENQT